MKYLSILLISLFLSGCITYGGQTLEERKCALKYSKYDKNFRDTLCELKGT